VLLGVAYAGLASSFAPLTWPAMIATLPPLGVAAWIAWHRPEQRDERPPLRLVRLWPWLVVVVLGTAWELAALVGTPRAEYPTLSSLISPIFGDPANWGYRFVVYLAWFAAGAWLVRR
jgi:hypothetical protein